MEPFFKRYFPEHWLCVHTLCVTMENSLPSPPFPEQQGAEGAADPLPSSRLQISLSFNNGEVRTLERYLTARTYFETPDAERAELHKVFQRFDSNGDGKLSVEEIGASLEKLGVVVSTEDLAALLCAEPDGDAYRENGHAEAANGHVEDMRVHAYSVGNAGEHNGSVGDEGKHAGYVDFTEFCELYRSLCPEDNEQGVICTPNGKLSDPELRSAFDLFDKNHDNFISATEIQSVLISLGFKEASSLAECKSMVASVDSNGDGLVSFDEFKVMMSRIKEDQ